MTTDLDRLIEAVEAGETPPWMDAIDPLGLDNAGLFGNAQCGSLDAAVALLETLLPGWSAVIQTNGSAQTIGPDFRRFHGECHDNPARALLLATLRAYRSTREGG